jgi:hypothetical protein
MAKTIEVIVSPAGEVKIDAVGFKGADCEKATAFLEKALGQVSTKQKKPEFYKQAQNVQRIGG